MKDKINVSELLRDCPKGMELDCTMYDNCTYEGIEDNGYIDILINTPSGQIRLTKEGCYIRHDDNAKCVIFPKGKTTWEGFHRPFEDGDILVSSLGNIFIFKELNGYNNAIVYCALDCYSCNGIVFDIVVFDSDNWTAIAGCRLANEEEKQKLFDAIKAKGYKWDEETKSLDKLVEPKFNIGDKVKHKCDKNNTVITITGSKNDYYYIQYYNNIKNEYQNEKISFTDQDKYELIIDKFDINTLIPFESRVLVRENKTDVWEPAFYGFFNQHNKRFYTASRGTWLMCIPYNEDTKHLTGTSDECIDFYKNWQ